MFSVRTTLLTGVVSALTLTVLPLTATAVTTTTTVTDTDDVAGPLDIAKVRHRVEERPSGRVRISYRITTYDAFATSRLDPAQRNFIIELNQDGESGSERNIRISSRHEVLVAELISNATRRVITTLRVSRPDDHSVRVTGTRRLIGVRSYFLYSNFHANRSRECGWSDGYPITCQDAVPERGWIRMDRPAWPKLTT